MTYEGQDRVPLGVVMERRLSDHPWQDHVWQPVSVFPGAPALDPKGEWTLIREGDGWARFHAGTLELKLFRSWTEGYKLNLSQRPPRVFVIVRRGDGLGDRHEWQPFHVTVCPYEAQEHLDGGDDMVEAVAMPEGMAAWVKDFVDRHHVDKPFVKRKRKRHKPHAGSERFRTVR